MTNAGSGATRNGPWRRFRRNRPACWSGAFLLGLFLSVLAWPASLQLARIYGEKPAQFAQRYAPDRVSDQQFLRPSMSHPFGTDLHGRDLLSRALYGAQGSILVGVVGAAVSLLIGMLWGATAAYLEGKIDNPLMRFVDILYSMPSLILVIVLITTFESAVGDLFEARGALSLSNTSRILLLVLGLGSVSWLNMARIVRGQVLSLRQRPFVEASRTLGAGTPHILARHILPNTAGVILTCLTLTIPAVMLYESFLSYLGLGIQPPMASLGSLIAEGADQINPLRIYWWLILFPGGLLVSTLVALSFLTDGIRDAWEVRT